LTLTALAGDHQVRLEVIDNGPGIPADVQQRLFEPFVTTKPPGEGSGLGLALSRRLVEGHDGTIAIQSQPGHGTTVVVTLPVAAAAADVSSETVPSPPVPPPPGTRVLLIDDEPGVQMALRRLLQRSGYELTVARNGREGLAALAERSYEAILCDMRMPELDGPAFYRELIQHYPQMERRVIFLTGDVLSPQGEAFLRQAHRPYLLKPFCAQDVRYLLQQVCTAP
jgi:CheY-like chemotaxis protein